jgi:hypothetical protein
VLTSRSSAALCWEHDGNSNSLTGKLAVVLLTAGWSRATVTVTVIGGRGSFPEHCIVSVLERIGEQTVRTVVVLLQARSRGL